MAGKAGGHDDDLIAEINVVPLVDIILVVLIIFMVTAPMVMNPVIDINLPNSQVGEESPEKPFIITVSPDGKLLLNNQQSSLEDVAVYAGNIAKTQPQTAAILSADRTVTLEILTQVISTVKSAGVKRVAFAVQKGGAAETKDK